MRMIDFITIDLRPALNYILILEKRSYQFLYTINNKSVPHPFSSALRDPPIDGIVLTVLLYILW